MEGGRSFARLLRAKSASNILSTAPHDGRLGEEHRDLEVEAEAAAVEVRRADPATVIRVERRFAVDEQFL